MLQVFNCIRDEHDPRLLLVALLICVFGSLISASIGRRAIRSDGAQRRSRLILAGVSTGLTIWSTHFSAMLAYAPGVEVRFNGPIALTSAVIAMLLASCGWLILSSANRWRGYAGGALIGMALCAAHFIDMSALRVDGIVLYDARLIVASILLGMVSCIAAGVTIHRHGLGALRRAAACLAAGTISLHLVAMASVRILATAGTQYSALDFGVDDLTLLVIASSSFILLVGAGLALHDLEVARATALDRERLKQSEEHHRYSVELNPQIPWISDAAGQIIEISPRWGALVGQPVENAHGFGWTEWVHPDDLPGVQSVWATALATGNDQIADVRYRLRHSDGSYRWFRARARPRRDENGAIMLWYGSLEDIHEQVNAELALRASEARYRLASRATNDVIWDVDVATNWVSWSGAVDDVLGYPEAAGGTDRSWWIEKLHPDERAAVLARSQRVMKSSADSWTQEFRFRTPSGDYVYLLSRGYVVRDETGAPVRLVGSLMDITARKRAEEELRWAAHHDALTRLPNRKLFTLALDAALVDAAATARHVGLIVTDLDGFKTLNDTLGHAAGDAALNEVAGRLTKGMPRTATVARLGGDEFAIILPGLADTDDIQGPLGAILGEMSNPMTYDGRQIDLSLSVGAATFPCDGGDSESLLRSADLALYAAKGEGAGNARRFVPAMRESAEIEREMRTNARDALLAQQIIPFYQPKVCLRTGAIIGFEALLRWDRPDHGVQAPSSIHAAFDDPRIAPELTDRMLTQIVADMARWRDQGLDFGRVAMNGSPEDFRRGDLADRILGELSRANVPPSRFELEITETVFLGKHAEQVGAALRQLRQEGATIALDDFGTGYASLTHLKQFPVDVLKIDQSFVSRIVSDKQQDAVIVGALIDLAKNLGIQTVAEGIEMELQAFMLRRRGCDVGQGYYFARPLAAADIPALMRTWDSERLTNAWTFNAARVTGR